MLQYRRNTSTSSTVAIMPPITDPTTAPTSALVLRPVAILVTEVGVGVEATAKAMAEVNIGIEVTAEVEARAVLDVVVTTVEVELCVRVFEVVDTGLLLELDLETVVGDCFGRTLVGTELEATALGRPSTTNPGDGIFGTPIKMLL